MASEKEYVRVTGDTEGCGIWVAVLLLLWIGCGVQNIAHRQDGGQPSAIEATPTPEVQP